MKFAREVEAAHQAQRAEHSARGILQSSMTVMAAIQLTEDHANRYLDQAIALVSEVKQDQESFELVVKHMTATFRTLEAHVRKATTLAFGGGDRAPNFQKAADDRFAEVRDHVMGRLQIERFNFLRSGGEDARGGNAIESVTSNRNPGGKPLADHWDAMWAAIAVQLWSGDLDPKKQADIKKAMFEWLNDAGVEAGDTAVTKRARALWIAIQDSERS
ncbi:hypothetical protein [Aurantiacibacter gilvus]|uniref:Uncharacterized protein n=1 Tax=Aurantiacibacter gilvus TaxID=3139141 RepID=A0ABU9IA52_9SPHN